MKALGVMNTIDPGGTPFLKVSRFEVVFDQSSAPLQER
jgi:hypothetical protein